MHVRLSTSLGTPVVAEDGEEQIGSLAGAVVHPDLGTIEGFYVGRPGFLGRGEELFLPAMDVLHWGHRIRVRSEDALVPLEDIVRLHALAGEGRTVIGQQIVTESGVSLGTCRDIQFETKTFRLEWIFPKKWLRFRTEIPASSIIEVRPDAIVVRDALAGVTERSVLKALDELAEGPVPPRLPDAS